MFERFTARARHTVVLSQEEARKLKHNYIGTEHILLGLLGEPESIGGQVLASFGITLEGTRTETVDMVGAGDQDPVKGHIPFTPRAKKVLELSLREALTLRHNYIGTEHILLGLIRESDGVAGQILRKHADPFAVRAAVLSAVPAGTVPEEGRLRRWARRLTPGEQLSAPAPGGTDAPAANPEERGLNATPAADTTLTEAAKLAAGQPVGSHHLLLAAIDDPNSAAARVLSEQLGVDLDQAKEALKNTDVAGTSDEQAEDAGRRQMVIQVTGELVTVTAADPVLVKAGAEALTALGDQAASASTIRGADLQSADADILATAWKALHDALVVIQRTATARSKAAAYTPAEDEAGEKGDDEE